MEEKELKCFDMPCGHITIISVIYSQLGRAKSENLGNIYSSFKQNIKSCKAKRRRQLWRTVKNNDRSKKQKKQLCTCSTLFCTFFCRCFAAGGGTPLYEVYFRYMPPHREGLCAVLV